MKKSLRCVKVAALFVGSVVGAGFATGQEIALFFGKADVLSLVLSALFMAFCAFAFLDMGANKVSLDPRASLAAGTLVTLCSFFVYAAMIAAAEEVLLRVSGVRGLSAPVAVAIMLLSAKNTNKISLLNLVAVPLMVGIILFVGWRAKAGGGSFRPIAALAYGGMNLLFSGALMIKEGEDLSLPERVGASALSGVLLFLMLLFMWKCVGNDPSLEMPFLQAATRANAQGIASAALLLAILTTMASCAYLVTEGVMPLLKNRLLAAPLVTLLALLLSAWGFGNIVRWSYPVVSALGLAATLLALFFLLRSRLKKNGATAPHPSAKQTRDPVLPQCNDLHEHRKRGASSVCQRECDRGRGSADPRAPTVRADR